MQHHLSAQLRNTGHGYAADELDRLLNVIGDVHLEAANNNGHLEKITHYQLAALIVEQSVDADEAAV